MIKAEMIKMIKSYKSWIIFAILMLFAIACSIDSISMSGVGEEMFYGNSHPTNIALLSNDNNIPYGKYFTWLMPIFLIIGYCDKYISEKKSGMANIYTTKFGRKKYFWTKIASSFIAPYILCGIPIIANLIINIIFMHGGDEFFGSENWDVEKAGIYLYSAIHHPYSTYIFCIFSSLFIFGLLGIACQSLVIMFKDSKVALIISFAIWMLDFSSRWNLGTAKIPFTNVSLSNRIWCIIFYCPIVIFTFILAYNSFVNKKDTI